MSGAAPPFPLVWARRCTLSALSTALVSTGSGRVDREDIDARIKRAIDTARSERADALRHEGAEVVVLTGEGHVRLEGTLRLPESATSSSASQLWAAVERWLAQA